MMDARLSISVYLGIEWHLEGGTRLRFEGDDIFSGCTDTMDDFTTSLSSKSDMLNCIL